MTSAAVASAAVWSANACIGENSEQLAMVPRSSSAEDDELEPPGWEVQQALGALRVIRQLGADRWHQHQVHAPGRHQHAEPALAADARVYWLLGIGRHQRGGEAPVERPHQLRQYHRHVQYLRVLGWITGQEQQAVADEGDDPAEQPVPPVADAGLLRMERTACHHQQTRNRKPTANTWAAEKRKKRI